jgi:type II secretory pathway component PulF
MPNYIYHALAPGGRELTQEATAPNEEALRDLLESRGLLVRGMRQKRVFALGLGGQRVKAREFQQANQEFVTLLQAGVTIPEALELVADRPESPVLGPVLRRVWEDVRQGTQLSAACAKYPSIFNGLYLSSLKTGEKSGDLAKPLSRYLEYLAQKIVLQDKISQAMVYPVFLLLVLVGVLGILFTFVLPRFVALYADFNTALPFPTRILMALVSHLPMVVVAMASVGLAVWLGFKGWASSRSGRLWLDGAQLRLPLIKDFTEPFLVSQMTRTLSTLLAGGTTLTEALTVTQESLPNAAFALRFKKIVARVFEGESLSKSLADEEMIPWSAIKMIKVGEAAGQLETMLQVVARSFEGTLEHRIQRALTLVEPIFILLAGLLIGTVIVVMYLPILRLSDVVK